MVLTGNSNIWRVQWDLCSFEGRQGRRGAVSMSSGTRHPVGVSCLWAHALWVSGMLKTDLGHLIYGLLKHGIAGKYSWRCRWDWIHPANGFGAACQVFTWHSVGCTMPFAILFLSRNTAKVSEVAASFGHCSMIHWISHCSG